MKAWMRYIKIVLTSSKLKKQIVLGENYLRNGTDLAIEVNIKKYMSVLKDSATITIDNLTYKEITQLIIGEFYNIEIWTGYQSANISKVFDGGVLYMSNKLNSSDRTSTLIIFAASQLVAKYGQKRLNLTLNSGINMYSAIKYVCKKANMPNSNVSKQFKKDFLTQVSVVNQTATSWLDELTSTNSNYITNSDSILEQTFSMYDSKLSNGRIIKLTEDNILLRGGYPRLTTDGLELTVLPSFAFQCGDTINIDNAIIDVSIHSASQISESVGAASQFNQQGNYLIYQMEYNLSNRTNTFSLNLKCKNRERIVSLIN